MSCAVGTKEGDKYYKEKSYKKAIIAYYNYLNGHKPTALVLYKRGRSFEEIGEYKNALMDFQKILDLDKKNR
mgnify:CR=1 FL=1